MNGFFFKTSNTLIANCIYDCIRSYERSHEIMLKIKSYILIKLIKLSNLRGENAWLKYLCTAAECLPVILAQSFTIKTGRDLPSKTAHCVGWAQAPKSTTSMYMFYANEMSIFQEFIHSWFHDDACAAAASRQWPGQCFVRPIIT